MCKCIHVFQAFSTRRVAPPAERQPAVTALRAASDSPSSASQLHHLCNYYVYYTTQNLFVFKPIVTRYLEYSFLLQ